MQKGGRHLFRGFRLITTQKNSVQGRKDLDVRRKDVSASGKDVGARGKDLGARKVGAGGTYMSSYDATVW